MTRDMDTLYATVLIFGVLSAVVYQFILRPLLPAAPLGTQHQTQQPHPQQQAPTAQRWTAAPAAKSVGIPCSRVPDHVAPRSARLAVNGGNNLLMDGMIAFRHGKAAMHEASLDTEQQIINRKERARVLSRLLEDNSSTPTTTDGTNDTSNSSSSNNNTTSAAASSSSSSQPPAKGSTVVLAIPHQDVGCEKLQKVIYLLATYYNLLVLIAVDSEFDAKNKTALLQRLRDCGSTTKQQQLSVDILPDHRIVLSSTVTGRVALARQLQRIELVLDFDPQVKGLLGRFGHRVLVYGQHGATSINQQQQQGRGTSSSSCSILGGILQE